MSAKRSLTLVFLLGLLALIGCRSAHVTSAILYIDQQMYDRAIAVLHEGLDYSPDEAEAYFYLGEAHSKHAEQFIRDNEFLEAKLNYSMAYDYYVKAREMDPLLTDRVLESLDYNYVLQSNNAKREYQAGWHEAAEGFFRLAYAALPDSTSPIKNLARMKIQLATENKNDQAMLNEALDLLDTVLAENPSAYELLSDKANVLGKLGRKDEAARIYDELLESNPDDAALMIDIANLAREQGQYERSADLLVRVMHLFETDDDVANDEDVYFLALQAASFYNDRDVLRYEDSLQLLEKALYLEDVPQESTLLQKLQTHYKYGESLEESAAAEIDPARKAELEQKAQEQFRSGVDAGEALVGMYFESQNGFFYLGLCHGKLGNEAQMNQHMDSYRRLQGSQ